MKRKEGYSCPVCRATNCRYNEHDTCLRYIPGREPGYSCPDFNCPTKEKEVVVWLMENVTVRSQNGEVYITDVKGIV